MKPVIIAIAAFGIAFAALALLGLNPFKPPPRQKPVLIFEENGCKVYKFIDNTQIHYLSVCETDGWKMSEVR